MNTFQRLCKWFIMPLNDDMIMLRIMDLLENHDCRMILPNPTYIKREDGCYVMLFSINAPSEETFHLCRQAISHYFTSLDCDEVVSENFEGEIFPEIGMSSLMLKWALVLDEFGNYNRTLLDRKPVWVHSFWAIKPLTLRVVQGVFKLLDAKNYTLFFKVIVPVKGLPEAYLMDFYLYGPPLGTLEDFSREFSRYIAIGSWDWIPKFTEDNDDFAAMEQLRKENLDYFCELTQLNENRL